MYNENTITCTFSFEELDEITDLVSGLDASLRADCIDTRFSPDYLDRVRRRYQIVHRLRVKLDQKLDEHLTETSPVPCEEFSPNEMQEITADLYRMFGHFPQTSAPSDTEEGVHEEG